MEYHESPIYGIDFKDQNIIDSINGSVYAAGIQYDIRGWLDVGSKDWQTMPDNLKKEAYLAAKKAGWTKDALKGIMIRSYIHLTENDIDLAFETIE